MNGHTTETLEAPERREPFACTMCNRHMRPARGLIEDHPGTVRHHSHGKCVRCTTTRTQAWRPSDEPTAELIHFNPGGGFELVKGLVLSVTKTAYTLNVDGVKRKFPRKQWLEVIE